jgi:hypothetical protein
MNVEVLSAIISNRAPVEYLTKQAARFEGGLNTLPACGSTYVRDPLLGLRLGCGSRLCGKLEHPCLLPFNHVSQAHGLPVWKFQRIVMRSPVVLVDLPKNGGRVMTTFAFQPNNPRGLHLHLIAVAKASSVPGRTQTAVLASPGAANPIVPVLK